MLVTGIVTTWVSLTVDPVVVVVSSIASIAATAYNDVLFVWASDLEVTDGADGTAVSA